MRRVPINTYYWFMREIHESGRGIKDKILVKVCHILLSNPNFGAKLSSFLAILTNITTTNDCVVSVYQYKFIISSLERYFSPGRGIKDQFLDQPCHILLSQLD